MCDEAVTKGLWPRLTGVRVSVGAGGCLSGSRGVSVLRVPGCTVALLTEGSSHVPATVAVTVRGVHSACNTRFTITWCQHDTTDVTQAVCVGGGGRTVFPHDRWRVSRCREDE